MTVKLYAHPFSTCGRRVAVVLKAKEVPFELVVPADGEIKSEAWLEKQPFGQMPYLVDEDGTTIYESRAIGRYIATKYADKGIPLVPAVTDIKANALLDIALSVESSNFDPGLAGLVKEKVFKPMFGGATDPVFVAHYEKTFESKIAGFERILSKTKYLAGDELTITDLFALPYGYLATKSGYDYLTSDKNPNLKRWWSEVSGLDAWKLVQDGIPVSH